MMTVNVFSRVFHIKYGGSIGTCFLIDVNSRQYFVTAKHVVNGIGNEGEVELYYKKTWAKLRIRLTGHSSVADVSVFAVDFVIQSHPLEPTPDGISFGQDVYFLGFPYGLKTEIDYLNRDFPMPLIKKGILSAMFFDQPGKSFLLDGHNNPGFSGGPVVFSSQDRPNVYKIAGVISGYRFEIQEIKVNEGQPPIQVKMNTGIIIAYSIQNALDLIAANPNGVQLA